MGKKFGDSKLDSEKEKILDDLQSYFKSTLPREKLRQLSCENLRSKLAEVIMACSSGGKLVLVKVK